MSEKLRVLFKKSVFPILLLLIVAAIFAANYKPGSYLIGWDNLQTEVKPLLAIKRATHASWQEYQSFGLTSGMAHAADLIRSVVIFIFALILPTSAVRFVFQMSMLYLGGLGFFYLLRYLGFKKEKEVLAFLGAIFYILNLGTVQIFSLPFEPFSIFFAALPWEILVFLKFIYTKKLNPKIITALVVINILSSPQAYLQTIFLVYFICLFFLSFGIFLNNSNKKKIFKRLFIAFILIVLVNLFWILPQVYFLKTSISVVSDSKINQLATDIVSNQNVEKGNIKNFARLEGFYFDLYDTSGRQIFAPWHAHFNNFFVQILSYLPFTLVLLGIFRKRRAHLGFVSIFILVSMMLLSNTGAVAYINSYILSHSFINQIFRSPFTKFVIPFALVYSYLFVSGLEVVYGLVMNESKDTVQERRIENVVFSSIVALLLVIYALPAFMGYYFADIMKVKVPSAYFEVAEYFETQDKNTRIGLLPEYTFWGWYSTDWGYDGSGFIWYWVEQPVVSRTFDVWSLKSESYFWELKYAIESINVQKFEDVLNKYAIDYLILDRTLMPVTSVEEGLQYDQLERILEKTDKVVLAKSFDGLEVYRVLQDKKIDDFVSVYKELDTVGPPVKATNFDQAYQGLKEYKVASEPDYIYPFMDLLTQTNLENKIWEIKEEGDYFVLTADLSKYDLENYSFEDLADPVPARVFLGKEIIDYTYTIEKQLEGGLLKVKFKKELIEGFDPTYVAVNNCRDLGDFGVMKRGSTLSVESGERGMACFGYASSLLDHWNGYLVKVKSENIKGRGLFFYIFGNKTRKQSKLETNLVGGTEYFILNPGYYFDDGYFFSFQNPSYESVESENKLSLLEVYLLPFDYLKRIRLVREGVLVEEGGGSGYAINFDVEKENYYTYKFSSSNFGGQNLILYQAYDPGWRMYKVSEGSGFKNKLQVELPYFFGEEVQEHYLVSNWANGWEIPKMEENEYLLIVFWPQMLEYIGIASLIVVWNLVIVVSFLRLNSSFDSKQDKGEVL